MAPSAWEHVKANCAADLESAVDAAIVDCGGDARAAVRALIVTTEVYEADLQGLRAEIDALSSVISRGYTRGRTRAEPRKGAKPEE